MSPVEILLVVVVACLLFYLVLAGRFGRRAAKTEEVERLRQEVRETIATNQTAFSVQIQQVGELLKNQLDSLTKQVGEQLKTTLEVSDRSSSKIDERLDKAASVIGEVKQSLGRLAEANQRIYEVGRDIAKLQEILRSPKLRGGLGELFLGDLLAEILPQERYSLQYSFKSGDTVDAIIRLAEHLVPVDAKFPLASFSRLKEAASKEERLKVKRELIRTVRTHIDAVTVVFDIRIIGIHCHHTIHSLMHSLEHIVHIKESTKPIITKRIYCSSSFHIFTSFLFMRPSPHPHPYP